MAKINVLDKHIAELIAAGEVVERPASVIKELVENSIDAGATSITVEIRRGGVSYIRVSDNGSGIESESVPVAFLRHATSKVSSADDLDAIASLGFRGEALASISAVSHVELVTKTKTEIAGTRLVLHGGDMEFIEEVGANTGTSIIVRDIFYNVPARMKFLKKDVSEGNAVANILDKIALSHPEISFRLIRDKKEVLYTSGDNKLSSAIYGVYGREFLDGLIPLEYSLNGIKIWGYISKPQAARPNRTMQSFFINGRFIKSQTAMAAISEGFKHSVMGGKHPACVIHIKMEFSMLDVNVHPAKLDVRFANEKPIFDVIYHGVKSALLKGDTYKEINISSVVRNPVYKKPFDPYKAPEEKAEQINFSPISKPISKVVPLIQDEEEISLIKTPTIIEYATTVTFNDSEANKIEAKPVFSKIENLVNIEPIPEPVSVDKEIKIETKNIEIKEDIKEEIKSVNSHKFVGEAFSTYIITEYGEDLMLIDKHAAHERLLYEKLKKNSKAYAQSLLVPVTVTLDKESYNAVLDEVEQLDKVGFVIDDFGSGTVIVRTAPLELIGQDIVSSITEIAGYLTKNRNAVETEYLDWVYHNVACRAAIKGGKSSSREELIELAKILEENEDIRYCPHGRPVYLLLKKSKIEREFGRI